MPWESTAKALLPASMAGLPLSRAMVSVGPPLSASVPRSGLDTPTRLPLVPLVRPPDPVPIKLFALTEDTCAGDIARRGVRAGTIRVLLDDGVVEGRRPGGGIDPAPGAAGGDGVVGDGVVDRRQDADLVDAAAILTGIVVGDCAVDQRHVADEIVGETTTLEGAVVVVIVLPVIVAMASLKMRCRPGWRCCQRRCCR